MEFMNYTFTTLGIITAIILCMIAVWWISATAHDRYYDCTDRVGLSTSIFVIALIAAAWMVYDQPVFSYMASKAFLKDVLLYAGIGVLYAFFEYIVSIFKSKKYIETKWKWFINKKHNIWFKLDTNGNGERTVIIRCDSSSVDYHQNLEDFDKFNPLFEKGGMSFSEFLQLDESFKSTKSYKAIVEWMFQYFYNQINLRGSNKVIKLILNREKSVPEAIINTDSALGWVTAWVVLWPAYLISFIFGDLFSKVFELITDVLSMFGGRLVKTIFKDSFKV